MTESKPLLHPRKMLPLIFLGFGLILIAVSAYFIVREASPRTDFSTIPVKVNYAAPELTLTDTKGVSHSIADYRGQVVLVNLWATWCPPCKEEMASLNHLSLLFANKNIKIVPISIDVSGALTVRSFYERLGLNNLSIYVDPSKNVMDALRITSIPTTILIGRDGREIGRTVGPAQWDAPASVTRITAILGQ